MPERHRLLPSSVPRGTLHEPHTPYSEVALAPDVADQAYTTRPANNNSDFESVQFSKTVQSNQINYLEPENVCQLFSCVQSVLHAALDFAAAGLPHRFPLRGHSPIQRRPQHPLHTHVNQSISQSISQSNTFSDCCTFLCSPRERTSPYISPGVKFDHVPYNHWLTILGLRLLLLLPVRCFALFSAL